MQAAGVNVLATCTYSATDVVIVRALQELGYSLKAWISPIDHTARVSSWEYGFVLYPVVWHPDSSPDVGEFSNMTSQQFSEAYKSRFQVPPSFFAAAVFASLCALAIAIERTGTLDTDAVATQLYGLELHEFYGNITIDANGQASSLEMTALQNMPKSQTTSARAAEANVSSLIFPMPPWPQRWCEHIGPGKTFADYTTSAPQSGLQQQCSGHGRCDASGSCVCDSGYGGTSCAAPSAPVSGP
eukprot:6388529-Prymnesium_polylepis.1